MAYQILLKATGENPNLFRFYKENDEIYETTHLEGKDGLVNKYEELLKEYPSSKIKPIHFLNITMNPHITEAIEGITGITAIIDENKPSVTLIAEGENLSDVETYNWTVVCDSTTKFIVASIGPSVTLNAIQSSSYIDSTFVTASVSIGDGNKYFIIKKDSEDGE